MPIDLNFASSLLGILSLILGVIVYYVGERKAVNPYLGFRIPPTYRDAEVWKAVNMRSGILTILHGIFMFVAGLVFLRIGVLTFLLILLIPLVAEITYGVLYAYQLEKTKQFYRNGLFVQQC